METKYVIVFKRDMVTDGISHKKGEIEKHLKTKKDLIFNTKKLAEIYFIDNEMDSDYYSIKKLKYDNGDLAKGHHPQESKKPLGKPPKGGSGVPPKKEPKLVVDFSDLKATLDDLIVNYQYKQKPKKENNRLPLDLFTTLITMMQKNSERIHNLYKLGVDLINFQESWEEVISLLLQHIYSKEEYEWITWYLYERNPNSNEPQAWDKDENPICYDIKSLWEELEKY